MGSIAGESIRLSDIGALLAVVVSVTALSHTVISDRKLRRREFLYRKNDRLIDFHAKFDEFKARIDEVNDKAREFNRKIKVNEISQDEFEEQHPQLMEEGFSTILGEVKRAYLLARRYRYIFSRSDMEKADRYFREVGEVEKDSTDVVETVINRSMKLYNHISDRVDAELCKVADQLRQAGE